MTYSVDNNIYKFDTIGNRFEFYYNREEDKYFVIDNLLNIKTDLEIKVRKYKKFKDVDELKQIRFWFPKPHQIDKKVYYKSISEIRFKLFGEFDGKGGSPLSLNIDNCKKIILGKYEELGYLLSYTEMQQSNDLLLKKVYSYLSNNGGVKKFIEITKSLGLNNKNYYIDNNGVFLKSSFEFIFFAILHHNNIKYEYESFKINQYIPDFYIPKKKILIEILGLNQREDYFKRTKDKERLYFQKGYNYKPIIVDRHRPKDSIYKGCVEIFGDLNLPNFNAYNRKYILTSDDFIRQLKKYLSDINEGSLKVSLRKDNSGFREKHRYYYNYALENYGTIQMAIKNLVGIPSTKFKSVKIEKYWMDVNNVKDELENVFKKEKRIPSKRECYLTFRSKYNIWNLYRFWGEQSLNKGGEFYEFVESLKSKYGYRDIELESKIKKEKEQLEFLKEIERIVMLVFNGKLPINGVGSLFTKHRPIYNYLFQNYGGVFYYIKDKIGYPPPHILRPKGYYKIEENVKYELVENWKKYKRILGDKERLEKKNDNTYYNMVHILGINQFKKGGKYFKFIESLKTKYGYDDSIERNKKEFEKNVIIYLKGINDGKWNTKTKATKELGIHSSYFKYVHNTYGNIFLGIKELIGFPNPNVIRYHKYYDDINNCKYEIVENIKRIGYLPKRNDLRMPPLKNRNSLSGVYEKWGVSEFEKGGIFYSVVQKTLKEISKT